MLLVRAAPLGLPRLNEVRVDGSVVALAVALVGVFVILSASLAAWRTRSGDTMRILRDSGRTGTMGRATHRLRSAFVAIEVALSLVLLAGAGVLGRSVWRLLAVQPGFDPTNTFTFWTFLPEARYTKSTDAARFYREAIDRLSHLPGVIAVGTTAKLPLEVEGFPYRILIWADDGSSATKVLPPPLQAASTSASYFGAMRIPLIAGRTYDDANIRRGAREAVVSRGVIEYFWHDATGRSGVGKRIRASANGEWLTIVGVVADVRDSTLTQSAIPEVYVPEEPIGDANDATPHTTARDMAFVVRTRGPMPGLPQRLRAGAASARCAAPVLSPGDDGRRRRGCESGNDVRAVAPRRGRGDDARPRRRWPLRSDRLRRKAAVSARSAFASRSVSSPARRHD